MSTKLDMRAVVLAGVVTLLSAGCGQSPTTPSAALGGFGSLDVRGGGANGPQASVTLEMGDLEVTINDGTNDTAEGTIAVRDNHFDDESKRIKFSVTGFVVTMETKGKGPWGTDTGSCLAPVVPAEPDLLSNLSYICTGPIRDTRATRITAVVTITDEVGNVLEFTARASANSDSYND